MWFINLSPALSFCRDWRCTEDCAVLFYTRGRGIKGFAFTGGPGALPGKCRVLSAPHVCAQDAARSLAGCPICSQPGEPWGALVSAAAPPRLLPGQLPQFRACPPRAGHVWDEHEGHQQFPSALVESICEARTRYTHLMFSFSYVHFGKSPVFRLAISKPVVVWNL